MALGLIPSDAALLCVQAGVVAAPRALPPRVQTGLRRFRGRGWAAIPVASIVGVIFAIRYASATADWLTWLALIAVPLLAIAALGWLMHGARPWLALLVPILFLLAWRTPSTLWGEGAAALLSALSCVTLGVLLGAVTPAGWLKLGVIAMAAADVWLVGTNLLQAPNGVLAAAAPGGGLPQLQSEQFGTISLGYGDLFVAGLLGAVWSARPVLQRRAALLTVLIAAVFDLLFLVVNELPATVPVALALVGIEWWSHRRAAPERRAGRPSRVSGRRGRWTPAAETPPPGS
ncbi:hypothetical protein [Conexibacter sp. DBS9H8]|uniref:hypothetical protein n=1 Tax=Conexibacter sp. DBS9H8 TaxID=2937801 RepID=UPI00200DF608|nr:hypothetical protein [Conexibacter sp. DBS9H8]